MGKEKSQKTDEKINITFYLNEEESKKLKQCATACGLSVSEFMRQLCRGTAPQPQPPKEFWKLLNTLYEVHAAFKKYIPYYSAAAETCRDIESFIVELQQAFTIPQQIDWERFFTEGAV